MTKIQKRLVGLGCLALVAAITTVAYNIPDANAESGTVNINFRVLENAPSAHFQSPTSGSETTNPNVAVVLTYANAEQITYTITKKGKDGAADQTITLPERAIDDTLVHSFAINLNTLFGTEDENAYGDYVLRATVSNSDRTPAEDSVNFTYKASQIDPPCEGDDCPCEGDDCPCEGDDCPKPDPECEGDDCKKDDDCEGDECPCEGDDCEDPKPTDCTAEHPCEPGCTGDDCEKEEECKEGEECEEKDDEECKRTDTLKNKVISVKVDENVNRVLIIIYNQNGKIVYKKMYNVVAGRTNYLTLVFEGRCLRAGAYQIANIPYDSKGKPVITEKEAKANAIAVNWTSEDGKDGKDSPSVPNTGDFLSNLNISNADFLITGLIGFSAAAVLGFVLLNKKAKRN